MLFYTFPFNTNYLPTTWRFRDERRFPTKIHIEARGLSTHDDPRNPRSWTYWKVVGSGGLGREVGGIRRNLTEFIDATVEVEVPSVLLNYLRTNPSRLSRFSNPPNFYTPITKSWSVYATNLKQRVDRESRSSEGRECSRIEIPTTIDFRRYSYS